MVVIPHPLRPSGYPAHPTTCKRSRPRTRCARWPKSASSGPRVSDVEWEQFHCCRWGVGSARRLPPGAWSASRAIYEIDPDEPLILGVDVGGSRPATAVVGCVGDEEGVRVALVEIWQGTDAVLKASAYIEQLVTAGRPIREIVFDPMRFSSEALRLERDHGVTLVDWPRSETRIPSAPGTSTASSSKGAYDTPATPNSTGTSPTPSPSPPREAGD